MAEQDTQADTPPGQEFIRQAEQRRTGIVRELWAFLRTNKKWWLAPIIILLILLGVLIISASTAVGPLLYPLF